MYTLGTPPSSVSPWVVPTTRRLWPPMARWPPTPTLRRRRRPPPPRPEPAGRTRPAARRACRVRNRSSWHFAVSRSPRPLRMRSRRARPGPRPAPPRRGAPGPPRTVTAQPRAPDVPVATTHDRAPNARTVWSISTLKPAASPLSNNVIANTNAAPTDAIRNRRARNRRSCSVIASIAGLSGTGPTGGIGRLPYAARWTAILAGWPGTSQISPSMSLTAFPIESR